MYGALGLLYFPTNLAVFVYRKELKKDYVQLLWILMMIRAASMSVVFIYVIPQFIRHFLFFAARKLETLEEEGISCWGIFIIMWSLIMWLSKVMHGLATIILVTMERLDPNASEGFFAIYSFSMRTFTYVVDFLNMSTLLYLFYR